MMHAYQQEAAAIALTNSSALQEHPLEEYEAGSIAEFSRQVIEELGRYRSIVGLME